ncbi:MAG: hypothetical protein PHT32_04850 [Candidatus Omnitrophica bacterium]|nr:hypothetical protein [Candidatus Omnitrophota bacterium]
MRTAGKDLLESLKKARKGSEPLVVFTNGLGQSSNENDRAFKDVYVLTRRQAATGIGSSAILEKDEAAGIRTGSDGRISLLIRCDDGQVRVAQEFGHVLTEADKAAIQHIMALATVKVKGRQAIMDYDSLKARKSRAKQEKEMGSMLRMMGQSVDDDDIEFALGDDTVRADIRDQCLDSDDIAIDLTGISISRPGLAPSQTVVAPQPSEIVAMPFIDWRMKLVQRLLRWTDSRLSRFKYKWSVVGGIKPGIDKFIKDHPRISKLSWIQKTVDFFFNVVPWLWSLHFFSVFFIAAPLVQVPQMIQDKAVPSISDFLRNFRGRIIDWREGADRPDTGKLITSYALPSDDRGQRALAATWGNSPSEVDEIVRLLASAANDTRNPDNYFKLGKLLMERAQEQEKANGKKAAKPLYRMAAKFYYLSASLDTRNASYNAELGKAYKAAGDDTAAAARFDRALRIGGKKKLISAERDETLKARAEMHVAKKEFEPALKLLEKMSRESYHKEMKLVDEARKGLSEAKKEKPGFWKSLKETFAYAFTGKNKLIAMGVTFAVYLMIPYVLPYAVATAVTWYYGLTSITQVVSLMTLPGWPNFFIATVIVALGRVAIYRPLYALFTGTTAYTPERADKVRLARLQSYANSHPNDANGHIGLIMAYLESGNTEKAMRYARTVLTTLPSGMTSETLGQLGFTLLDTPISDDKVKTGIRGLITGKVVPQLRSQLAFSNAHTFARLITARIALNDKKPEIGLWFFRDFKVQGSAQDKIGIQALILKLDLLKALLEAEINKPERDKKAIDTIVADVEATMAELGNAADEDTRIKHAEFEIIYQSLIRTLDEKREADKKAEHEAAKKPEAQVSPKKEEKNEGIKEDRDAEAQSAIELDTNNFKSRLENALHYLKSGKIEDARKELAYVRGHSTTSDEISQASLIDALMTLTDSQSKKLPDRHIMAGIKPGAKKDIIRAIIALRLGRGRNLDMKKLLSHLEALIPQDPNEAISDENALYLAAALSALTQATTVLGTETWARSPLFGWFMESRVSRSAMRAGAFEALKTLKARLDNRKFSTESLGKKVTDLLQDSNLDGLIRQIVADTGEKKIFKDIAAAKKAAEKKRSAAETKIARQAGTEKGRAVTISENAKLQAANTLLSGAIARERAALCALTDPAELGAVLQKILDLENAYYDLAETEAEKNKRLKELSKELLSILKILGANETHRSSIVKQAGALQSRSLREAKNDQTKRSRYLAIIDFWTETLKDKAVNESGMTELNRFTREYVSFESQIIETALALNKPGSREAWKKMDAVRQLIDGRAHDSWGTAAALLLFSNYLDLMFARESADRSSDANTLAEIKKRILGLFKNAFSDPDARVSALEALTVILQRKISAGEDAAKTFLIDEILTAAMADKDMQDLFLAAAAERLRDTARAPTQADMAWVSAFIAQKIAALQKLSGDEQKASADAFVALMGAVRNKAVVQKTVEDIAAISDDTLKNYILLALADKISGVTAHERLLLLTMLYKNGNTDVRKMSLSQIEKLITAAKPGEIPVQDLAKHCRDMAQSAAITDYDLVKIYNALFAAKGNGIEGLDDAMKFILTTLETTRQTALKNSRTQTFDALMELVKKKRALAALYEKKGDFEKAQKELEEANKLLADELDRAIALQEKDKVSEYGGDPQAVIKESDSILQDIERVLRKQDKLDAEFYISRGRGSVRLARFEMSKGDGASQSAVSQYLDTAFADLATAQKRDPRNANLASAYRIARFEKKRLTLLVQSKADFVVMAQKQANMRLRSRNSTMRSRRKQKTKPRSILK